MIVEENPIIDPIDYEGLRKEAMGHIEALASDLWTDYNIHDPGITIMEILCFALTELGLRANLPVNDLIAELLNKEQAGFYPSHKILISKPVTISDYRKLLIDIDGVKNAWFNTDSEIQAHHSPIYRDLLNAKLAHMSSVESYYYLKCTGYERTPVDAGTGDTGAVERLDDFLERKFTGHYVLLTRVEFKKIFEGNSFLETITLYFGENKSLVITFDNEKLEFVWGAGGSDPKQEVEAFYENKNHVDYDFARTRAVDEDEEDQLQRLVGKLTDSKFDLLASNYRDIFDECEFLSSLTLIFNKDSSRYLKVFKDVNGALCFASQDDEDVVKCQGYYSVDVELEEDLPREGRQFENICTEIHRTLNRNRNLCELFPIVNIVREEYVCVCFDIELSPAGDVEEVMSDVVYRLDKFINPDVHFYSLKQMKERMYRDQDRLYGVEDIFNGPLLKHGFIDDRELAAAQRKGVLHASDLIQEIMDAEHVQAVNSLMMSSFHPDEHGRLIPVEENHTWCLPLTRTRSAKLLIYYTVGDNTYRSEFTAHKGRLPYSVPPERLLQNVNVLKARDVPVPFTSEDKFEKHPTGRTLDLDYYYSVRNHFPMTYALKDGELMDSASDERKAKVMQLRAFLLFFDQLLANAFKQLSKLGGLLSFSPVEHTYFVQLTEDAEALKELLSISPDCYLKHVQKCTESRHLFDRRRNRFLDHLLARFAEEFRDYYALAEHVYGDEAKQRLIENKQRILKNIVPWSSQRACAENILCHKMTPTNLSGLEYRIRVFLGMALKRAINQSNISLWSESDSENKTHFGFWITNAKGPLLRASPFADEEHREEAIEKLFKILMECWSAINRRKETGKLEKLLDKAERVEESERRNILGEIREHLSGPDVLGFTNDQDKDDKTIVAKKKTRGEGKWVFELSFKDDAAIVLKSIGLFKTELEADFAIYRTVGFLLDFHFIDKMFIFEHILLLLGNSVPEQTLPVCTDSEGGKVNDFDPYSFRITVVLPGETELLSNMRFRQYLERSIRETTPSHIFPKICWVSNVQMRDFGDAYTNWRHKYLSFAKHDIALKRLEEERANDARADNESDALALAREDLNAARADLIKILNELESVYGRAVLRGAPDSEEDGPPVILGNTKLGTLEGD